MSTSEKADSAPGDVTGGDEIPVSPSGGPPPTPPPPPGAELLPVQRGQKIAGRYLTQRILGRGGMGVVYSALEEEIEREVAIKFILVDPTLTVSEQEDYYARFKKEAQALGSLPPHPNRVVLYQYGYDTDNDLHYMAMEFVQGEQLSEVMQSRTLSAAQIVEYTRQIAMALEDVHASSLVHRDLKPENLIVTRSLLGDEQLKLIDFGIARAPVVMGAEEIARDDDDDDDDKVLHGTVLYMAPELLVDGLEDARTDIYAIGVILFELVTGVGPFDHLMSGEDHEDILVLVRHHVNAEPGPIRPCVGVGELPEGFEEIISRCLAKEPEDRFADASELLEAIDAMMATQRAAAQRARDHAHSAAFEAGTLARVRLEPQEEGHPDVLTTAIAGTAGLVAASDAFGTTRLWDFRTGAEVWTIPAPEDQTASEATQVRTRLTFSHNGQVLALGDRMGRLWLYDLKTRARGLVKLKEGSPRGVSFDKNAALMVVSTTAGTIELWDLSESTRLMQLAPEASSAIACVALAPQRQYLAAGFEDGALYLWNFLDKSQSGLLQGPPPVPGSWPVEDAESPAGVAYVGFSPNGQHLAVVRAGGFLELWSPIGRDMIDRITLPESESPRRLAFSPNGARILVAYNSGAVVTVDVEERAVLDALRIPRGRAVNIGFDADDVPLASIARGATVQVWDLLRRGRVQNVGPTAPRLLDVTLAHFGETVLTLTEGGFIDRWDLLSGRHLGRLRTGLSDARSLNKAPEPGRILLFGSRGLTALSGLEINGIGPIKRVALPIPRIPRGRSVQAYAISPDKRFVAYGFAHGELAVYAYSEASDPAMLTGSTTCVRAMNFSPDNRFLAVAYEGGRVAMWDLAALRVVWEDTQDEDVNFLTFTPTGRLLSVPRGDRIEIWNMDSQRRVGLLEGHTAPIRTLVHGLEGRLLLSSSDDRTARLWDVAAGRELRVLDGHPAPVTAATLDPNLRLLLTTAGPYLSVWRVSDAALLARFVYFGAQNTGEDAYHGWATYAPTGHYIASTVEPPQLEFVDPTSHHKLGPIELDALFDPRAIAARLNKA